MAATSSDSSRTFDDDVPASTAVVEAVSSVTGTPVLELPPLRTVIDPDALDELFSGSRTNGRVTFRYAGHDVTVHADRTIHVSN